MSHPLPPILPHGTAVVLLVEPRGADGRPLYPRHCTGIIVASPADPEHAYRVELPRGEVLSFRRRELEVLSIFQSSVGRTESLSSHDLLFHHAEYAQLEAERDRSTLPETETAMGAISDLVVRVRLASLQGS